MKIKYLSVFTDDIEKQIAFFTGKLGFEVYGKKSFSHGQESVLIKTNNPDLLIAIHMDTDNEFQRGPIIINSQDCLNDYHNLKMAGVIFHSEPHYLPIGLCAEFSDPSGNQYLLLEERSYTSQI
jgi:catechol 2,3-dioxygenase-like lactoylglutathione lyase family enzyme